MAKQNQYKPVKYGTRKRHVGGFDALWLADDHLLLVQNNIYTQGYKRFFFNDIQAITIKVTNHWKIYTLCLVLPLALTLLLALLNEGPARIAWLCPTLIFLLCLLINWYKGPTCQATLVTKVQSHELPVNRLKKAQKVVHHLRGFIEKGQGVLRPEEITGPVTLSLREPQRPAAKKQQGKSVDYSYSGTHHLIYFSLLLLIAGLTGLQLQVRNGTILFGVALLCLGAMIFMIISLIKQNNSAMAGSLKLTTWATFVFIALIGITSYFDATFYILSTIEEGVMPTQLDIFRALIERDPAQDGFFKGLLISCTLSLSTVGIAGLVQTLNFQKKRREVNG